MAVALNNSNARAGGNGISISFSYTSSSGSDRLMLASALSGVASVTGVTYAGASLSVTGGAVAAWGKVGQATGANTITFSYSSSYADPAVAVSDYTGVDQATPLGTKVSNSGTGNTSTTGSVTCPAGGLVVGSGYNTGTNAAHTADAGTTSLGRGLTPGGNLELYSGYRADTGGLSWSGGTYSPAWYAEAFPVNPVGALFLAKGLTTISQAIQGMY